MDHQLYEQRRKKILEGMTGQGGWTREQLAEWGVPWPPPRGWRDSLVVNGFPYKPEEKSEGSS